MKKILALMLCLLWSLGAFAAPVVTASQFTPYSGNTAVVAIPAGPVGDLLMVTVAMPCTQTASLSALPEGWGRFGGGDGGCAVAPLFKFSDGTETSLAVSVSSTNPGVALALRISGASGLYAIVSGGTLFGSGTAPNAMNVPYGGPADTLWLTYANAMRSPTLQPAGYTNTLVATNDYSLLLGNPPVPRPFSTVLMLAQKTSVAGSEDAGPWLLPASSPWKAVTIGIR